MIATTQSQSDRLLRCGVPADTADMSWHGAIVPRGGSLTSMPEPSEEWDLWATPYGCMPDELQAAKLMEDYNEIQPAWSLSRLLGLLPKRIKRGDCSDYTLSLSCDGCFWDLEYTYARYCGGDDSLVLFEDIDPIEVCVKAIEWLSENGYKLNEQ